MPKIIQDLRSQIDRIDDEILELLSKRLNVASQIGAIKRKSSQKIDDIQREEEIIARLSQKGVLDEYQIKMIYQQIFLLTKQIQEEESCSFNPSL